MKKLRGVAAWGLLQPDRKLWPEAWSTKREAKEQQRLFTSPSPCPPTKRADDAIPHSRV